MEVSGMVLIFLILLLFIVFIISYFVRIYTTFHFYLHNETRFLHIKVRILGIIVYNRDMIIPANFLENKQSNNLNEEPIDSTSPESFTDALSQIKKIIKQLIDAKVVVRRFMSKIHIHEFNWITKFGTGDASVTGMLSGGLWAIKGSLIAIIVDHMKIKSKPVINVVPIFQHRYLYSECKCMVSFRVGQAIVAFFRIVRQFKKSNSNLNNKLA